jgi:hypothetical protein
MSLLGFVMIVVAIVVAVGTEHNNKKASSGQGVTKIVQISEQTTIRGVVSNDHRTRCIVSMTAPTTPRPVRRPFTAASAARPLTPPPVARPRPGRLSSLPGEERLTNDCHLCFSNAFPISVALALHAARDRASHRLKTQCITSDKCSTGAYLMWTFVSADGDSLTLAMIKRAIFHEDLSVGLNPLHSMCHAASHLFAIAAHEITSGCHKLQLAII